MIVVHTERAGEDAEVCLLKTPVPAEYTVERVTELLEMFGHIVLHVEETEKRVREAV